MGRELRRFLRAAAALAISAMFSPSLAAIPYDDAWATCDRQLGRKPSPDEQLRACTAVLSRGRKGNVNDVVYVGAMRDRAHAYEQKKQYTSALADLDRFFEASPGTPLKVFWPREHFYRAMIYFNIGRYEKAVADLDQAEKLGCLFPKVTDEGAHLCPAGPTMIADGSLRGDIAMQLKQYDLALTYYEFYSKKFPDTPGLAEKITLAKVLSRNPERPPPERIPVACKMYPNLCP